MRLIVSNDGRWLAVGIVNNEGLYEVWISEVDRPRLSRLVSERGRDCSPSAWSADTELLAYGCTTATGGETFVRRRDGTGDALRIKGTDSSDERYSVESFWPGGEKLLIRHWHDDQHDLLLLPLDDPAAQAELILADAHEPGVSPDGRWLLYSSDVTGRAETYLRAIRPNDSLGPEIPVPGEAGGWWEHGTSPQTIAFARGFQLYRLALSEGPDVRFSKAEPFADLNQLVEHVVEAAVLPGRRFLVAKRGEDEAPPTEVNLVLNWFDELDARLSVAGAGL